MKNKLKKIIELLDGINIDGAFVFIIPKKGDTTGTITNLCSHDLMALSKEIRKMSVEEKKTEKKHK